MRNEKWGKSDLNPGGAPAICPLMRRTILWLSLLLGLAVGWTAEAATGKVLKVLPHFLDQDGRHTLSPSLYDRDAYQALLLKHPEKRSSMRFDIQWKSKGEPTGTLKLKLELRGLAHGDLPSRLTKEQTVEPGGWSSRWAVIILSREEYKALGEVTAWRATLWENDQLLGEQKSFLW
jgi:hypothetical protein